MSRLTHRSDPRSPGPRPGGSDEAAENSRRPRPETSALALRRSIDATGSARLPGLLSREECAELALLYPQKKRFRSFVDLGGRGYGEHGDYRYFDRPLPRVVQRLRTRLYRPLAQIANAWQEELGSSLRFPATLREFSARCAAAGQRRPTPLLLRYDAGGLNCLHQDRYGEVAFPLQVVVMLARPGGSVQGGESDGGENAGADFGGGEFLLVEQRPRQQSRGEAIVLQQGEGLVFPNAQRPLRGRRGVYRATVKHGVSRVLWGERLSLGIIFHDAE